MKRVFAGWQIQALDACVQKTVDDSQEGYSKNIPNERTCPRVPNTKFEIYHKTSEDRFRRKSDTYNKQQSNREVT